MEVKTNGMNGKSSLLKITKVGRLKPNASDKPGSGGYGTLRWWILGFLVLAMVISYMDRGNISMVAPLITDLFKLSPEKKGYIFSAFLLGYAIMQIPSGMVVDRFGLKWTYTIAFFFWCLTAAAFGLAMAFWHFIAIQVMLGIWESISGPAGNLYISKYFKEDERGFASGLLVSGSKIGPAIGMIVAGFLIAGFGWRMLFILCGLVPLIWIVPWLVLNNRQEKVESHPEQQSTDLKLNKTGIIPLSVLLKYKTTWGIFLGYFFYGYVWFMYISWLPSYLYEVLGFSIQETGWWAGFAYGCLALVVVFSGLIADILIRRGNSPTRVRKGFIIAGFSVGTLILQVPFVHNPGYAITMLIITISGMGLATANTWAITQSVAPPNTIGTLAGIQNFGATLGGFIAPISTGFLIKITHSYTSAFVLAGFAMLAGIFSYVFIIGKVEPMKIKLQIIK
jgi:MFS transporter, ACS family, D-galactonate transporter